MRVNKGITICLMGIVLIGSILGSIRVGSAREVQNVNVKEILNGNTPAPTPNQLIRFHVVANSDSDEDQALKRAVRDAILEEVSPRLASSKSLDESRQILLKIRPEMEKIGLSVVKSWGKNYTVRAELGDFSFPTKSYGTLVLPAGTYEALRVVIGEGEGSNWWCVLFPPLCFVDIEYSTAVQVDGKVGIPIQNDSEETTVKLLNKTEEVAKATPKVRFFFWEKIKQLFG